MLLLFYKSFPVIAQYLIYTSLNLTVPTRLMSDLLCTRIKTDKNTKADIEAKVVDRIANTIVPSGFSVKSLLGGASTLLNAGKTTNFVFEIKDLNINYLNEINAISTRSKVQDRIKAIKEHGGTLIFKNLQRKEFESNLKKIDTAFPVFIAQMLFDFFSCKAAKISDLTSLLSKNRDLWELYGLSYSDYEFKIKNFLQSAALGMIPSKVWDGFTKVHGGYIVVRNDGVVICYHLYNRDEFLSYLYENTKFESASTKRHEYGSVYLSGNKLLFNLNLQIRFIR
ncbi:HpaII family restriction endonuclease [Rickettsia sp. MEAM1 (Bemisia tabaci)]|uniref:HpaII family restriction endonuclease n=4 Tax=unclassified Rickettsia TaxID=114295 RepID=UPI0012ED6363|nr:HpaII family restriction endonuclease [Rickettsia sp. MEAM1 (Bemisia tabaci)]